MHSRQISTSKSNPPIKKTPNTLIAIGSTVWSSSNDDDDGGGDGGTAELVGLGDVAKAKEEKVVIHIVTFVSIYYQQMTAYLLIDQFRCRILYNMMTLYIIQNITYVRMYICSNYTTQYMVM